MKYNMIATKPGLIFSYFVSGGTSMTGAAKIAQQSQGEAQMYIEHGHSWLGFELSEWALIMGMCGVVCTMVFQYLNYKNNKKKK